MEKELSEIEGNLKKNKALAEGRAKKIVDLKVRLAQTESEAKVVTEHLKEARARAHANEIWFGAITTKLEVVRAACVDAHDKALAMEKAKASAEAECSSLRAKVLKVSSGTEEKVCDAMAEASKRAEESLMKKVREAQLSTVEAFR